MGRKLTPQDRALYQQMTLLDDLLMNIVFKNSPDCVQQILNAVLSFKTTVQSVTTQYKCSNVNGHSVIFDIHAKDENNVAFDIEIQKCSDGAIPKRARYHSGLLDSEALQENQKYSQLKDTYVIFITEHDVLKGNNPLYRIERHIDGGQCFNDGSHIIYVNTAYEGVCEPKLMELIHDFRCVNPQDIFNCILKDRLDHVKNNPTSEEEDTMCEALKKRIDEESEKKFAEGAIAKAKEIARDMLNSGEVSIDLIAKFCNLTVDEVKALGNPV